MNGEEGWFPFGTDCSRGTSEKKAYCISGKCLVSILWNNKPHINGLILQEFGQDNTPLSESEFALPLLSRSRRSLENNSTKVTAILQQRELDEIVSKLNATILGKCISGVKLFFDNELKKNNVGDVNI